MADRSRPRHYLSSRRPPSLKTRPLVGRPGACHPCRPCRGGGCKPKLRSRRPRQLLFFGPRRAVAAFRTMEEPAASEATIFEPLQDIRHVSVISSALLPPADVNVPACVRFTNGCSSDGGFTPWSSDTQVSPCSTFRPNHPKKGTTTRYDTKPVPATCPRRAGRRSRHRRARLLYVDDWPRPPSGLLDPRDTTAAAAAASLFLVPRCFQEGYCGRLRRRGRSGPQQGCRCRLGPGVLRCRQLCCRRGGP